MLSSELIAGQLHTRWAACNIVYKDVTGSTNTDARELALSGALHGTLVVADKQESGRGSNGRGWETPAGTNIAMSLVVRPRVGIVQIPMLTLVMGLSVAEGIEQVITDADCGIKWPNDVVLAGRKVCGILTELHLKPEGGIADAVIGVGINVNMVDFPEEIRGVAGSLLTQTGIRVDRNALVARVMESFEANYEKFEKTGDMSLLKDRYEARLVNRDRKVMILDPRKAAVVAPKEAVETKFHGNAGGLKINGQMTSGAENTVEETGTCLGITDSGALIVKLDTGEKREVKAGEVSVRGIYGYV